MKPIRIDQIMGGFAVGDATSHAALLIRDQLRALAYASEILVSPEHIMPAIRSECRPLDPSASPASVEADIVLHHFGIRSSATDAFLSSPKRKVLIYHNITPASFFTGYDDQMAARLQASRDALPRLLEACDAIWTVSEFNATELRALTARPVCVFPLPLHTAPLDVAPDVSVLRRFHAPLTNILAVGRLAPNKRIEELIYTFSVYQQRYNNRSRLVLVGSDRSVPRYTTYLKMLAHELRVENVSFEGFVWPEALTAYYQLAEVLVSASDHEGYCLPLLEAMYHGVPVIAKSTGGTPEAMQDAGIAYEGLTAGQLAAVWHRALTDASVQHTIRTTQQARIAAETTRDLRVELQQLIEGIAA